MSPRDGLQNEKGLVKAAAKINLVDMSDCGFQANEATAFVSPRWVPQMADAAEFLGSIRRRSGVAYSALVPNLKGYEAANCAHAVAVFASASETFSQKNINCTIAQSLDRFQPVLAAAASDTILVRAYVSCVTDCPYEGPISPGSVARVARQLLDMGCYEIFLGDTVGRGTPKTVLATLEAVVKDVPTEHLAGHFHDTGGKALENIAASLERGVRTFHAAVGGLGGCPFAPGSKGKVGTLAVAELLAADGWDTGLQLERLEAATAFARGPRGPLNFETIRIATNEVGIATLTLARPEERNAMSAQMSGELTAAAEILGSDGQVRTVVLTGEGESFCAGADLAWMQAQASSTRTERVAAPENWLGAPSPEHASEAAYRSS